MNDGAKPCLTPHDDVGYSHLATQSREEDDELNGVDVVGDDNELSFLRLDEGDDVVQPVLGEQLLFGVLGVFIHSGGGSSSLMTGLLFLLRLRAVLVQKLEQLRGCVLVQSVCSLSDRRRNFEALIQNDLLAMQANILGPLDEASHVSRRLDVLADTECFGVSLKERVFLGLDDLAGTEGSSSGLLAGSGFGFERLVIETKFC